jgi:hypothetical protein
VRRVLERTELRAARRPEKAERRGVTIVPKRGVRVVQQRAPAPALPLEIAPADQPRSGVGTR